MRPFSYSRPTTVEAALAALADPSASPLGGGSDLLVALKEELVHPAQLVDLRSLPGARDITVRGDGSVRLGGGVRIADVAIHPAIRERFSALAEASRSVGTPALRNMGTVAGNLCQRPRCWYLRRGIACFKSGGTGCPAVDGENQYHAIFCDGPCHAVHPSDLAVALTALEAVVEITGQATTTRLIPVEEFYRGAAANGSAETVLAPGEFVAAIELPARASGGVQRYTKLMQRGAWDFALVSLAAVKRTDGLVRLVLGGVALQPHLVNPSIGEDVSSGTLDDESIDALAERALHDAAPLSCNGYKVRQAASLLKAAIRDLSQA